MTTAGAHHTAHFVTCVTLQLLSAHQDFTKRSLQGTLQCKPAPSAVPAVSRPSTNEPMSFSRRDDQLRMPSGNAHPLPADAMVDGQWKHPL